MAHFVATDHQRHQNEEHQLAPTPTLAAIPAGARGARLIHSCEPKIRHVYDSLVETFGGGGHFAHRRYADFLNLVAANAILPAPDSVHVPDTSLVST